MEYYRTLHLDKEPFSNTPDPDAFFYSRQHLDVLQKVEISVRLRRGLCVVTGQVGTGKTTLSRQLIQKLSGDQTVKTFLLLDPGFTKRKQFLAFLLDQFTGGTGSARYDEFSLKERLKSYLFTQGVEQDRTVVLLIDEGQKLPVFCIEILRELLNFETNGRKLLQIVIFAQKEFNDKIKNLGNFTDRIDFFYMIGPLGIRETANFIEHRLNSAFVPGKEYRIFSYPAYVALYYYTRGYPRKIVHLCHHILLTMIIREKKSAGIFLVSRAWKNLFNFKKRTNRSRIVLAGIPLILIILFALFYAVSPVTKDVPGRGNSHTDKNKNEILKPVPPQTKEKMPGKVENHGSKTENGAPSFYGSLTVRKDDTLYNMIKTVYGDHKKHFVQTIAENNPAISDPSRIKSGMKIRFPVVTDSNTALEKNLFYILFHKESNFDKAYEKALLYDKENTRIIPVLQSDDGYRFHVIAGRTFSSPGGADMYIRETGKADEVEVVKGSDLTTEK